MMQDLSDVNAISDQGTIGQPTQTDNGNYDKMKVSGQRGNTRTYRDKQNLHGQKYKNGEMLEN